MTSRFLILAVLACATAGCARYQPLDLYGPGPAGLQEARALHYDPYPDPEAGPEVVGGRPREYNAPPHQPAWVQQRAPFEHRPPGTAWR